MKVHTAKKEDGFSLIEVMFGLGILLIVVLAANGQMMKIVKQAKKAADLGKQDSSFRGFGQRFMFDLQQADVALSFQRLPIPVSGCDLVGSALKPGPCVYQLKDKKLEPAKAKFDKARAIEFFSDLDSSLKGLGVNGSATDPLTVVQMKKLSGIDTESQNFATWVLKDESSAPFPLMSRSAEGIHFTVADEYATSKPGAAAGRFVMMRGSSSNVDLDKVRNRLMVVFNGFSPNQYFVQRIQRVIDCKQKGSCDTIAKALNPAADLSKLAEFVAIELRPMVNIPFKIPLAISGLGSWGSQSEAKFMFPTENASLLLPDHVDFETPIDARRILHFFHTQRLKSQILAIPVEFKGYFFEKIRGNKKRLMCATLTDETMSKPDVVLNDVPQDSYGIFARKIGTQDVSFFIYE